MIERQGDSGLSDEAALRPPPWEASPGNGAEPLPVKRGRGRPPKPRASYESYPTQRLLATLREAEEIAAQRRLTQLLAEEVALGLHSEAFRVLRRLIKGGRIEALQFYAQLSRYMAAVGLLDPR